MTGRSSSEESSFGSTLWPDAELRSVLVDYDSVSITIRESTGLVRNVRCEGYIGYSICGFWDEVVIDNAELTDQHEAIDRCIAAISRRLGSHWPETGNPARNTKNWKALIIRLSDGASLEIVAAEFTARTVDGARP
jgi:hypothetical protein